MTILFHPAAGRAAAPALFLPLALFLSLPLFRAAADVSLNVTASRPGIYLGESFNLTVAVNGADRGVPEPDTSALRDADVRPLGSHSNSRSSISIINGRMTRESFQSRVFSYEVRPRKAGAFRAGPVRITIAGRTYSAPGPLLDVAGIEKQDFVIAGVRASSTSVLVEEPFTVTLSVAVRELPEPYARENEPVHPDAPPHLSAGFLEAGRDDPGLKGPDLQKILNGLVEQGARRPAFLINDYASRPGPAGFDSFFDDDFFRPRPIRFRLPPARIVIGGKKYREYTLSLDYTPAKEGEFTFGPLTFKGRVIAGVRGSSADMREIYAIGPAVTVRVVPPPDEGRPDSFIGSVGTKMSASAAFDTSVCKVGDPLTLSIDVTGDVSASNMRPPLLNLQPELAKDFRIYDDSVSADTIPGGKRFRYRVRPVRAGTLEFPPVKLAFYDTARKAYAVVSTQPVPLQADATTQIAAGVFGGEGGAAGSSGILCAETLPQVSGITLSPDGCRGESLLPPAGRVWALALAGPALCLLAVLLPPLGGLLRKARAGGRRSGALRRALRALSAAERPDAALRAVRAFLSERLDAPGRSLTAAEAEALLLERRVGPPAAAAFRAAFQRLDEAVYRPDASAALLDEAAGRMKTLLPQIDRALSSAKKRARRAAETLALLAALTLPPANADATPIPATNAAVTPIPATAAPAAAADPDAARRFLWDQANAQTAAASTPEEYRRAAETYGRLVADGVGNGPLFLNLGTALAMGEDGRGALAAFNRAERHTGATPETRRGIAAALALKEGRSRADLPWSRTAFFWHTLFPCQVRVTAALFGWLLLWLGLFFRILFRRRGRPVFCKSLSEACLTVGALLFLAFGASSAVTWFQEKRDAAAEQTRLPPPPAAARELAPPPR